jgi:hypothetical protein
MGGVSCAKKDEFVGKPRVVVLSDMGNEPDDQMSFVRLLLYSNELDLEALIATTSTWQKNKVQPDTMRKLIAAYGSAPRVTARNEQGAEPDTRCCRSKALCRSRICSPVLRRTGVSIA